MITLKGLTLRNIFPTDHKSDKQRLHGDATLHLIDKSHLMDDSREWVSIVEWVSPLFRKKHSPPKMSVNFQLYLVQSLWSSSSPDTTPYSSWCSSQVWNDGVATGV